jgi:hypothetical protein
MARPALQALADQQKLIDRLMARNAQLVAQTNWLLERDRVRTSQIHRLTAGLQTIAHAAGEQIEGDVKIAMLRKKADEQNPAQPVPEPAPEPATESTVQTGTPEAFADVTAPGMVPGVNQDVAADAVTTTYTPGQDIAAPPVTQLVDVTRPIEGTQGPRPIGETKTDVEVRVGPAMNPQVAFPVNGPFANAQRTSSLDPEDRQARTFASLNLARLQIKTGITDATDDIGLSQKIASDQNKSLEQITAEIETLTKVAAQTSKQASVSAPSNLVPRSAGQRVVPAMGARTASGGGREDEDLDLSAALLG